METSKVNEWFLISTDLEVKQGKIFYKLENIVLGRVYDEVFQNESEIKLFWFSGTEAVQFYEWVDRENITPFNEFFKEFYSISEELLSEKQLHLIMFKYITYLHSQGKLDNEVYKGYIKDNTN